MADPGPGAGGTSPSASALDLRLVGFFLVLAVAIASWLATCAAWRFDEVAAGVRPLESRRFGALTVVAAGTGGARENRARLGPCIAIGLGDRVVLVDAGRGTADALRGASIPVSQPDTVFLSSLLPENTVGLDDLRHGAWLEGRRDALRLVGPPGTAALARSLAEGHGPGLRASAASLGLEPPPPFEVLEVGDDWSGSRNSLDVRAGILPGGPLEALAYRFEAGGRSAVVAAAGWAPDALVGFARGAGLLVHEAVFVPTPEIAEELGLADQRERLEREAALHTSIQEVGGLAQRAGVGALALVRLSPPPVFDFQLTSVVDEAFGGWIHVPDDGDEIVP